MPSNNAEKIINLKNQTFNFTNRTITNMATLQDKCYKSCFVFPEKSQWLTGTFLCRFKQTYFGFKFQQSSRFKIC